MSTTKDAYKSLFHVSGSPGKHQWLQSGWDFSCSCCTVFKSFSCFLAYKAGCASLLYSDSFVMFSGDMLRKKTVVLDASTWWSIQRAQVLMPFLRADSISISSTNFPLYWNKSHLQNHHPFWHDFSFKIHKLITCHYSSTGNLRLHFPTVNPPMSSVEYHDISSTPLLG